MITVKIPATVGESSPILWRISPPGAEPVTVVAVVAHIHGDGTLAVSARHGGVLFDDDNVSRDDVELIISRPTGAAHLAWWLIREKHSPQDRMAAVEAIGSNALDVYDVTYRAARGEALSRAESVMLRDYAHHIAGVNLG